MAIYQCTTRAENRAKLKITLNYGQRVVGTSKFPNLLVPEETCGSQTENQIGHCSFGVEVNYKLVLNTLVLREQTVRKTCNANTAIRMLYSGGMRILSTKRSQQIFPIKWTGLGPRTCSMNITENSQLLTVYTLKRAAVYV